MFPVDALILVDFVIVLFPVLCLVLLVLSWTGCLTAVVNSHQ